jgi:crossover junction endodeoxyribonuclease RuvC
MNILGIDPGTIRMGYAVVKTVNQQPVELVNIGYIDLLKISHHPEKLKIIYEKLEEIIQKYDPKIMSIEAPFYGKNVQSMLKLGRSQGVAMAVAFAHQLSVVEYSPKKIKLSITGNGNASKEQVAKTLKSILNFEYTDIYLDATDAMAAAICHCFQLKNPIINSSSNHKTKNNKKNSWEKFLKQNPDIKIEISGHTDNSGDKKFNQTLSTNRAKAVYDYLIQQGKINPNRLTYKGYADTKPKVPNDSPENKAKNRRTEFKIIGK